MFSFRMTPQLPSLAFILVGSMDWLTTVIGIFYFGAVEANPALSSIAMTNLPLFTAIKLTTTLVIGLMFYQAEKNLLTTQNKETLSFRLTKATLRITYVVAITFLSIVVLNNLMVVFNAI